MQPSKFSTMDLVRIVRVLKTGQLTVTKLFVNPAIILFLSPSNAALYAMVTLTIRSVKIKLLFFRIYNLLNGNFIYSYYFQLFFVDRFMFTGPNYIFITLFCLWNHKGYLYYCKSFKLLLILCSISNSTKFKAGRILNGTVQK